MDKDSRMFQTNKSADEKREEHELTLELSIGGIFGKSETMNRNVGEFMHKGEAEDNDMNVQSKREIQALRRRELRRKREEKLKKSVGFGSCGSVSGPFVDNKDWLERQIVAQNDEVLEMESAHKKKKIVNLQENMGSVSTVPTTNGFLNQKAMPVCGGHQVERVDGDLNTNNLFFRPTASRSFRPYQENMNRKAIDDETEGGGRLNSKVNSNASAGYASSAFSDSQCSSRLGVTTDDSRSNSSNSHVDQQLPTTTTTTNLAASDQPTQTISTNKLADSVSTSEPKPNDPPPESTRNPPSSSQHQQASFLGRMPSVSTTGNGPNGKTISGFLYRYTKNEVSIVCVCHGQSFSPAGFVDHAGGVGILHPLKHINISPPAFPS